MKTVSWSVCSVQSVAAARERASTEEVSVSAVSESPSAGGRWWLQNWFPDWSGWYGAQELTEPASQPAATETLSANSDSEKALGNNTVLYCVSLLYTQRYVKSFPSHRARWAALVSVFLALSQTPAYTARPQMTCCVPVYVPVTHWCTSGLPMEGWPG